MANSLRWRVAVRGGEVLVCGPHDQVVARCGAAEQPGAVAGAKQIVGLAVAADALSNLLGEFDGYERDYNGGKPWWPMERGRRALARVGLGY